MDNLKIVVVVENHGKSPLIQEHGLSLYVEYQRQKFLFDTGAGRTLLNNLQLLNIDTDSFENVILSHGHNDHTSGLDFLTNKQIWGGANIEVERFSMHPDRPIKNLSMPCKLNSYNAVKTFTEIMDGVFLTGAIPRVSSEDCGGPFFLDMQGANPDLLLDEVAILLDCGVLLQGCCHAGIINTMEHCKNHYPNIKIHTIVGGLHLLHASDERLKITAEYLRDSSVNRLELMHCTGDGAIEFLHNELPNCQINTPHGGDIILIQKEQNYTC